MIMVVVDHSGCPQPLFLTDLSMLMPIFFISSGYFFKDSWFDRKWEYVKRKFKNLYIPFVKWSIIFLLLHNVFFSLGIINAQYGNDSGITSLGTSPYLSARSATPQNVPPSLMG